MINHAQPILRLRQLGLAGLLAGLLVAVSLALLYWNVLAKASGSGANGCLSLQQAVTASAAGDTILVMPVDFGSLGGVIISKNLIIQGGWKAPAIGCNPGPFDTITDAINIGGYVYSPTLYGGYRPQFGKGIIISPTVSALLIQQMSFDLSASYGAGISGVISNGAQIHLENLKIGGVSTGPPLEGINLEVRGGSRLIISDTTINFINVSSAIGGLTIHVYDTSEVLIHNTRLVSNRTLNSGGGAQIIVHNTGRVTVTHSSFIGNQAANNGGGLAITGDPNGRVWIINSVLAENTAGGSGAGIFINGPTADIIHSTIASPTLNSRQGIYIAGGTVRINNTIIASHMMGLQQAGGIVTEDYNVYFGNTTHRLGVTTGAHTLDGFNPNFINPVIRDYHLSSASVAIDRGLNAGVTTDIDGDSRPSGISFDIGADEFPFNKSFLPMIVKN